MTDETPKAPKAPEAKPASREITRVESETPLLDTGRFEHYQRLARALALSSLLPESVRGKNPDECFSNLILVFDLAERWQMNALSLAQCISVVHGKMCVEGKLIQALIEKHLGIDLQYEWIGKPADGDKYGIIARAKMPDGRVLEVDGTVGDWRTLDKEGRTKQNWRGLNARNQLAYRAAREWCRLYKPSLMLGVYSDDEMDERRQAQGPGQTLSPPTINTGFATPEPEPEVMEAEFTEGTDDGKQPDAEPPEPAPTKEKPKAAAAKEKAKPTPDTQPQDPEETETGDAALGDVADPETSAETETESETEADIEPPEYESTMESIAAELQELDKFPALLEYCAGLGSIKLWKSLKEKLTELSRTEDWKAAVRKEGQFAVALVRRRTYERAMQLTKKPDLWTDVTLFRCYVEYESDREALETAIETFKKGEVWGGLASSRRDALAGGFARAIERLSK